MDNRQDETRQWLAYQWQKLQDSFFNWLANGWTIVFAAILITAAFALLLNNLPETPSRRAEAALRLWLSDCSKPVDDCAARWDESATLRDIYKRKIP